MGSDSGLFPAAAPGQGLVHTDMQTSVGALGSQVLGTCLSSSWRPAVPHDQGREGRGEGGGTDFMAQWRTCLPVHRGRDMKGWEGE